MKIAHEAPLSIFDKVQELTDYDYALVHLFEENEEYLNKFMEARYKGREIILDNSIFELGTAFDPLGFAKWVECLKSEWYIIPDVLDNASHTVDNFERFIDSFPDLPGRAIAVAQGATYLDLVDCYNYLVNHPKVEKIALSFNHPFYQDYPGENKYQRMLAGRQDTIRRMIADEVIVDSKPHHLLGCGLPQEFMAYRHLKFIDSVDTSNPVIHGMKGIRYQEHGLDDKESVKMFTLMDDDVLAHWDDINYNIAMFRKFCKG